MPGRVQLIPDGTASMAPVAQNRFADVVVARVAAKMSS